MTDASDALDLSHLDLERLEKLGEGYEAEIFALEDGRVLRLFREGRDRNMEPERIAIPAALAGGIPAPELGEAVVVQGRTGTVMERIDGENQLDLVAAKPWVLRGEGFATGRLHAQLHRIAAPAGLETVAQRAQEWITSVDTPPHLAALASETLEGLEGGDRLCHSDFHPGNVLVEGGGRRVVIDWGFCSAGPPEADVARSLVLLRTGEPLNPGVVMRLITRFFRPIGLNAYLRGYRSAGELDMALVRRWMIVRAIEHLSIVRAIGPEDGSIPDPLEVVEKLIASLQREDGSGSG